MKLIKLSAVLLLIFFAGSSLGAQKLYTWTDETGVLHITDKPPPKRARIKDVTKYREKTPQELDAIQREKEDLRRKYEKEEQIERARQSELQAREADQRANEAVKQAREKYEQNLEYIKRLSTTRDKRKQFRKRIQRLKDESEAAQTEAQMAVKQAEEAAQKARMTAEEAEKPIE